MGNASRFSVCAATMVVRRYKWFREASQLYCRYMRGIKRNAAKHWSPALT